MRREDSLRVTQRCWDLENMGDPKDAPDRFRDASPIFLLDRIAAPVEMIAGANDPRCRPPKRNKPTRR